MKKTLIALAALGVVGAASAQVTISGGVSMGLYSDTADKKTVAGVDAFNSNSIAMVASEDLGGGLTASAKVQMRFDESMADRDNGDLYAELAGDFGSVRLGQFSFNSHSGYNPFGSKRMSTGGTAGGLSGKDQVQYVSPSFGGVTVAVATQFDDTNGLGKPATGVKVTYGAGPLSVQYISSTAADNDASNSTNGAKYNAIGATYDAGMIKGYVTSYQVKAGVSAATAVKEEKGVGLGFSVPMGALTFNIGNQNRSSTDSASTALDTTVYGATYALSKRTSAEILIGNNTAIVGGAKTKTSWIGVNHTF